MYRKIYKKIIINERIIFLCKFIFFLNCCYKKLLKRNYLRFLKKFFFIFICWFVVVDGRSKYLKDENKSIDGKCYIK